MIQHRVKKKKGEKEKTEKQIIPDTILEAVEACKSTRKRKVIVTGVHKGIL